MTTAAIGGPLAKARAAVPGHQHLAHAQQQVTDRLRALRAGVRDTTPADSAVISDVFMTLTTGADLPSDLGTRILRASERASERAAEVTALVQLGNRLDTAIRILRANHADTALDVLRGEHDDLVEAATALLGPLSGVQNARQAVERGVGTEWAELDRLAAAHANLRIAQAIVVADATRAPADPPDTFIEPVRTTVTTFGTARAVPPLTDVPGRTDGIVTEMARGRRLAWDTPDPVVNLRATLAAGSWLPSLSDLAAAEARADSDPPPGCDPLAEIPGTGTTFRAGGWAPRGFPTRPRGLRTGEPLTTPATQ